MTTLNLAPEETATEPSYEALLAVRPTSSSRRSWVVVVSVSLHVIAAVALLSLPQGQELLRRVIPVEVVTRRPPPPPPQPKKQPQRHEPPQHHSHIVHEVSHAVPPQTTPAAPPAPSHGLPTVTAGTMAVPEGTSLEGAATPSGPAPLDLVFADEGGPSTFERLPAPDGPLKAVYPEIAKLAGLSGSAIVSAFVLGNGRVDQADLISASDPVFGRAAVEAVRGTWFHPALRDGLPVACSIQVPIRYFLADDEATVAAGAPVLEVATSRAVASPAISPVSTPSAVAHQPAISPSSQPMPMATGDLALPIASPSTPTASDSLPAPKPVAKGAQ